MIMDGFGITSAAQQERKALALPPYALHRKLVSSRVAAQMYAATRPMGARRVICGDEGVSWTERDVDPDSWIGRFFRSDPCMQRIAAFSGVETPESCTIHCWTSEYALGEYINPHLDGAGDVQIVLSLRAPSPANGGFLHVCYQEHTDQFHLSVGDAMLFRATAVQHWTTPLAATAEDPNPERIVVVARYFFARRKNRLLAFAREL
jgi:hypothetical protein